MTLTSLFEKGEQTLIRPDHHHREVLEDSGNDFEREGIEKPQRSSERSTAKAGFELFFKERSKLETKSNIRRKEQSSLVKQGKNAMMSSINPREQQSISKARKSFKTLYDEHMKLRTEGLSSGFVHAGLMLSDTNFSPSPRQEKSKSAISKSPSRPMSDGITMGTTSTFDRLMVSMGTQKGVASSSTKLQPQLTSLSIAFTPVLGTVSDVSGKFASVMTGLEELRQDVPERIDRVEKRAQQGYQGDELADAKLQARSDQAQFIRNTDQREASTL